MSKFRKKPVVIDAFKWTGGPDQTEDPEWIIEAIKAGSVRFNPLGEFLEIDTLEGTHRASFGDFIIRGVKGEIYPCKPDIFAMTYDAADAPAPTVPASQVVPLRIKIKWGGDIADISVTNHEIYATQFPAEYLENQIVKLFRLVVPKPLLRREPTVPASQAGEGYEHGPGCTCRACRPDRYPSMPRPTVPDPVAGNPAGLDLDALESVLAEAAGYFRPEPCEDGEGHSIEIDCKNPALALDAIGRAVEIARRLAPPLTLGAAPNGVREAAITAATEAIRELIYKHPDAGTPEYAAAAYDAIAALSSPGSSADTLAAKLVPYTSHVHGPGPLCERAKHSDYPCTCGLEVLLGAVEGKKGDGHPVVPERPMAWTRDKIERAKKAGEIAGTAQGLAWSLKNDKDYPLSETLRYLGEIADLAKSMYGSEPVQENGGDA